MLRAIACPNCGTEVPYCEVVEEGDYVTYVYKCPKCGHVVKYRVRRKPNPWEARPLDSAVLPERGWLERLI